MSTRDKPPSTAPAQLAEKRGRLLIVTTVADTAHAFLRPYANHMRMLGWRVALATADPDHRPGLTDDFDEVIAMPWRRSILQFHDNIVALHKMREILGSCDFDVVHTHTPIASFLTRLACVRLPVGKRPVIVYTAHGFHFHRNGEAVSNLLFQLWEKMASFWTDYLIVMNEEDRANAEMLRLAPAGRILYTRGIGVDFATYGKPVAPSHRREFREQHAIPPDAPVVVCVAEFIPRKRHVDLLHAVALSSWRDWHVLLAGEGRLKQELLALARQLGIEGRCHFVGYVKQVSELLVCADVMALPSMQEGLSRAVMEAMATGLPVVGADSRGIRDLLENDCGLLHPVGDVPALQTALERIISTPALGASLIANARAKILKYGLNPLLAYHTGLYEAARDRVEFTPPREEMADEAGAGRRGLPRRIIVIGGATFSLTNMRGRFLQTLHEAGFEVLTIASDKHEGSESLLRQWGIRFCYVPMERSGFSPRSDAWYAWKLFRLLEKESPDVILAYTHKPVIYSALAKAFLPQSRQPEGYGLITGLGYMFTNDGKSGLRKKIVQRMVLWLYRNAGRHLQGFIFQNHDDLNFFESSGILRKGLPALLVAGSGVDLSHYDCTPLPIGSARFTLIARLLTHKGVREFAAAAEMLKREKVDAEFVLVGPFDPNPSAISHREVMEWHEQGWLTYLGEAADVRPALRSCTAFVLPSYYREGIPRTILEAMSMGRPIITADSPGCRETVFELGEADELGIRRGVNGFLVPPRSPMALAAAMRQLIVDPSMALRMGTESRRLAERHFQVGEVNRLMADFMHLVHSEKKAPQV